MIHTVAIMRNPIYNVPEYREQCMQIVIDDAHKYYEYNNRGVLKYGFPWVKDCPTQYFCSELVNHYAILNSGGQQNLAHNSSVYEDRCTPWQIQSCNLLSTIYMVNGSYPLQEMDYVLTTDDSEVAQLIKTVERGKGFEHDQGTASHAGIIVKMNGLLWIVEMIMSQGSTVSSIRKYGIVSNA